jgi:predicted O-methyltransferase YrrM
VFKLGLITGLREKRGRYYTPNFERGLILDRLCEILRPEAILEIGTGRGMGALVAASASLKYRFPCKVTSLDIIPVQQEQTYPIEIDGHRSVIKESVANAWDKYVAGTVRERVEFVTGSTSEVLPKLVRQGKRFSLIFIDAGHDALSVANDLSYASMLLGKDGAILMDDFTPHDFVGVATCLIFTHCKKLFETAVAFQSDGVTYGPVTEEYGHGMVLLHNPKGQFALHPGRLWRWRILRWVLHRCIAEKAFPVSAVNY